MTPQELLAKSENVLKDNKMLEKATEQTQKTEKIIKDNKFLEKAEEHAKKSIKSEKKTLSNS